MLIGQVPPRPRLVVESCEDAHSRAEIILITTGRRSVFVVAWNLRYFDGPRPSCQRGSSGSLSQVEIQWVAIVVSIKIDCDWLWLISDEDWFLDIFLPWSPVLVPQSIGNVTWLLTVNVSVKQRPASAESLPAPATGRTNPFNRSTTAVLTVVGPVRTNVEKSNRMLQMSLLVGQTLNRYCSF